MRRGNQACLRQESELQVPCQFGKPVPTDKLGLTQHEDDAVERRELTQASGGSTVKQAELQAVP